MNSVKNQFILFSVLLNSSVYSMEVPGYTEMFNTVQPFADHSVVIRMKQLESLLLDKSDNGQMQIISFVHRELDLNFPHRNLKIPFNRGESMIALLKMLSLMPNQIFLDVANLYVRTMQEIILISRGEEARQFQENQPLAEYVLDWYTYVQLLDILSKYEFPWLCEMGWIYYSFMLAIENSMHLKHSFSREMLYKLNNIRNKANGHSISQLISKDISGKIHSYLSRFPFRQILIDMELSNRDKTDVEVMFPQMKRTLIEDTTQFLLSVRMPHKVLKPIQILGESIAFSALLELNGDELSNFIDEIAFIIDDTKARLKHIVINRLQNFLIKKYSQLPSLNSALTQRMEEFNYVRGNTRAISTYIVNNCFQIHEVTPESTPQYLDNYVIISKVWYLQNEKVITNDIIRTYYNATRLILKPIIFDNPQLLSQYDNALIAIYKANPNLFQQQPHWFSDYEVGKTFEIYANAAENFFKSFIFSNNPLHTRNQIRILLHLGFHTSNLSQAYLREQSMRIMLMKLALIYINLIKLDAELFIKDSALITEWYRFTLKFPKEITDAIRGDQMIEDLFKNVGALNQSNDADAVLYICFARILNLLALEGHVIQNFNFIKTILELDKRVGYADASVSYIQAAVLREKQLFYTFYSMEVLEFEANLQDMIAHRVELLTSISNDWNSKGFTSSALPRRQILDGIFTAISNNPIAYFIEVSNELQFQLQELTFAFNREVGLDAELLAKIRECGDFFPVIT